jgi:DNA-binding MarR family transcriptional regulator
MKSNPSYEFVDFIISVHQITDELSKDIKPQDLTPIQFRMLQYIGTNQPLTLSRLSDCLQMSMPNTSRELKKLGEKNLCEKFTAVEDRRKQYIRLSKKGETMINEAFTNIEKRLLDRLQDTSKQELTEIRQALKVLHSKVFHTNA